MNVLEQQIKDVRDHAYSVADNNSADERLRPLMNMALPLIDMLALLVRTSASESRDARQARVFTWAKAAFGDEQSTSIPQRGLRLLEEAVEAFQATGGDRDLARHVVDYVFSRPAGALDQELGGVAVTTLALAAAAGLSAEAEEIREVTRVLAKPLEEFARRNAAKNDAGLVAPGIGEMKP